MNINGSYSERVHRKNKKSKYLQAIRVTVQDMVDVEPDAMTSCAMENDSDEDVMDANTGVWATGEGEGVDDPIAETIANDPVDQRDAEVVPPWRRVGRRRVL